jgi:hypothetical protein
VADDVGQPPFQRSHGFHRGLAGRDLAVEVGSALGRVAQLDDSHDVQRAVDLPVASADSRCRTCSPEDASMGAVPFQDAKWALSRKPVMSPTSTSSLAAPEGPMPFSWVSVLPVAASSSRSSLSAALVRW